MRILFITDGFPYPLTSGYLRHYHFIRELSRNHEVVLFSAVDSTYLDEHRQAMAPYTSRVLTFMSKDTKSRSPVRRAVKWVRTLTGRNRTLIEMREALKTLLREERFDILLLSGEYTYHVVRGLDTPPIVSEMCDAYSLRTKGRIKHASWWRKLPMWLKYMNLRRLEQEIIARARYVLFASERDAVIVPQAQRDKSVVVPNGVDTDYWQRSSNSLGSYTVIFTGAMHYPPNQDAALYLLSEIAPRVRKAIPEVRFLLVGHSPPANLVEAARQQPGVTVTGFVEDMRPYLEQATVFAAPLRFGSGIQNKVLEAMAMELPVVTTAIAADGLCGAHAPRPPVRIADRAEQFALLLIDELAARSENPTPFDDGRAFVEQNFVWANSAAQLERILAAATANEQHFETRGEPEAFEIAFR